MPRPESWGTLVPHLRDSWWSANYPFGMAEVSIRSAKCCQAAREKARGGSAGCLLSRTAMPPAGVRAHTTHSIFIRLHAGS